MLLLLLLLYRVEAPAADLTVLYVNTYHGSETTGDTVRHSSWPQTVAGSRQDLHAFESC